MSLLCQQLVEGMRREGILQVLGSQALPVGVASQEVPHLPPSGNVLEMENWRPKKYDPILRTAVSVPHIAVYLLFTPLYMYTPFSPCTSDKEVYSSHSI